MATSIKHTGTAWSVESPEGTVNLKVDGADHLTINTTADDKQPRINSRNFAATSGSAIGFQSKPAGNAASGTLSVIGCEISPRFNAGKVGASIIGAHVDAYLKGTTGDLTGDMRGAQIELVDDDGSTRTVAGKATHLRVRSCLECTVTGTYSVFRIEAPEKAKKFDCIFDIDELANVVSVSGASESIPANTGYIVIKSGDTAYRIPVYANS